MYAPPNEASITSASRHMASLSPSEVDGERHLFSPTKTAEQGRKPPRSCEFVRKQPIIQLRPTAIDDLVLAHFEQERLTLARGEGDIDLVVVRAIGLSDALDDDDVLHR